MLIYLHTFPLTKSLSLFSGRQKIGTSPCGCSQMRPQHSGDLRDPPNPLPGQQQLLEPQAFTSRQTPPEPWQEVEPGGQQPFFAGQEKAVPVIQPVICIVKCDLENCIVARGIARFAVQGFLSGVQNM